MRTDMRNTYVPMRWVCPALRHVRLRPIAHIALDNIAAHVHAQSRTPRSSHSAYEYAMRTSERAARATTEAVNEFGAVRGAFCFCTLGVHLTAHM